MGYMHHVFILPLPWGSFISNLIALVDVKIKMQNQDILADGRQKHMP
jgi:hypothetical protein